MTVNSDNFVDLRWKNGTVYHFIPISFQIGSLLGPIIDRKGNTITIARDGSGNVTSITDPVGRSLVFAYDSSNRVTTITDPIGRTAQYTYNAQGSLATFTDPTRKETLYQYDSNNNLLEMTDPRQIVRIQNTLDSNGRVTRQVRADGGVLTFSYTPVNPLVAVTPILATQVTDSTGVQAIYRFNMNGYVTDMTNTQGQIRSLYVFVGHKLAFRCRRSHRNHHLHLRCHWQRPDQH
jgi:YD repeat-containing protein